MANSLVGQTKKSNTVVIHTDTTASQNYLQFMKYLLEKGYSIEDRFNDIHVIKTEQKTADAGLNAVNYTLDVTCFDKMIKLKAQIYRPGGVYEWHWNKPRRGLSGDIFSSVFHGENGIKELVDGYPYLIQTTFEEL